MLGLDATSRKLPSSMKGSSFGGDLLLPEVLVQFDGSDRVRLSSVFWFNRTLRGETDGWEQQNHTAGSLVFSFSMNLDRLCLHSAALLTKMSVKSIGWWW